MVLLAAKTTRIQKRPWINPNRPTIKQAKIDPPQQYPEQIDGRAASKIRYRRHKAGAPIPLFHHNRDLHLGEFHHALVYSRGIEN